MKTVDGIYTSAKIFTDTIEDYALSQIRMLCDNPAFAGSRIRIMPDVYPGKAGTIGFTATLGERLLPEVVGADMGCGVTLSALKPQKVEFQKLDRVIRERVPAGSAVRRTFHRWAEVFPLEELICSPQIQIERVQASLGTLGSGNHFIELDQDGEGGLYVLIHSGSRRLGGEVTEYYLREGQRRLKKKGEKVPYEMTYLEGVLMEDYLHDLWIVQEFARQNREAILDELSRGMRWKVEWTVDVPHNYVDMSGNSRILRKGAVSAKEGETVVVPINMRDGVLLGKGLGNPDWNESAPHGAGRVLRRDEVKRRYTVSAFKKEMRGIYSSCIGKETLDEAPFAYRGLEEILEAVADTMTITGILRPVYNFKAGSR